MEPDKNVLITGGFGNLGSWLTEFFYEAGYSVYVLSRKERSFIDKNKYIPVICDLENDKDLQAVFDEIPVSRVIHAAGFTDAARPDSASRSLQVNALGTFNLLQACARRKIGHFIYISTFHVYGKNSGTVLETDEPEPRGAYGLTHWFAEEYIRMFQRNHHLPYTILRLTNSYGCPKDPETSQWHLVLNDLSKMACTEGVIRLKSNGKPARDYLWMGTVCGVIEKMIGLPAPDGVFNLSAEKSYTVFEIAGMVKQAWKEYSGHEVPVLVNESDASLTCDLYVDSQKIKKIIPYTAEEKFREEATKIFSLLQK